MCQLTNPGRMHLPRIEQENFYTVVRDAITALEKHNSRWNDYKNSYMSKPMLNNAEQFEKNSKDTP